MSIIEIALIGVGLAMDAFAVSICKGLAMRRMNYKKAIIIAAFFGVFQALMPALGYVLGTTFANKIAAIDHWIAFILLALIGANMIKEALSSDDDECQDDSLRLGDLIMLSIATSIDALAVGITFAFFNVSLLLSVSMIGIITFIICVIGVKVGNVFGEKYKSKAELAGGLILIVMGAKILIDHLFFRRIKNEGLDFKDAS